MYYKKPKEPSSIAIDTKGGNIATHPRDSGPMEN
jgi:hypothetical protein